MFIGATSFNQDLSSWDVSNGKKIDHMFAAADTFNQDLSSWDVSSGQALGSMFMVGADSFNQDLSSWDVSKGKDFSRMFIQASSFQQNLCAWGPLVLLENNANVEDMFSETACPNNGDPKPDGTSTPAPIPFGDPCSPGSQDQLCAEGLVCHEGYKKLSKTCVFSDARLEKLGDFSTIEDCAKKCKESNNEVPCEAVEYGARWGCFKCNPDVAVSSLVDYDDQRQNYFQVFVYALEPPVCAP
jgi:hypothetical protein